MAYEIFDSTSALSKNVYCVGSWFQFSEFFGTGWSSVNWPYYLFQAFLPILFPSALVFIISPYSWKTPLVIKWQLWQVAQIETSSVIIKRFRLRWNDLLMFSAGTLTTAGSIRLSARTKAPSSRVSSNIVAACVCSVEFMSSQDLRASGLRRLSTVSTIACNHGNKGNDRQLIFFQHFPWKKKDPAHGISWGQQKQMRLVTCNNYNGKWNTFWNCTSSIICAKICRLTSWLNI